MLHWRRKCKRERERERERVYMKVGTSFQDPTLMYSLRSINPREERPHPSPPPLAGVSGPPVNTHSVEKNVYPIPGRFNERTHIVSVKSADQTYNIWSLRQLLRPLYPLYPPSPYTLLVPYVVPVYPLLPPCLPLPLNQPAFSLPGFCVSKDTCKNVD